MDVKQIERLEALLAKATPGPWTTVTPEHSLGTVDTADGSIRVAQAQEVSVADRLAGSTRRQANADLIAEAINALPALLQLARAVNEAPRVEIGRHAHMGPMALVDSDALVGQTVALVPVPVKEG